MHCEALARLRSHLEDGGVLGLDRVGLGENRRGVVFHELDVDERSAAVWTGGEWRAAGPGNVTVIDGGRTTTFASGAQIAGLRNPARMLPSQ